MIPIEDDQMDKTDWFVCLKTNSEEYGGMGLTFSTIFSSDKRRGLE